MRYIDEYRHPEQVAQVVSHLHRLCAGLSYTAQHPLHIMEVCGGHTHAIFRYGLDRLLPDNIEFIHGPGCPVCVLPMGRIDSAIAIACQPSVIFCTFGDAMRVPGKTGSLLTARARGADVRIVYSPLDALQLAKTHPEHKVVFFGIGFETTMPATALTLQQARTQGINNFFLFCQHITLIPALRQLLSQPDHVIDAFLAPGHVSMIIGTGPYQFIAQQHHCPLVITGFEPLDILQGVLMVVQQKIAHHSLVENQYRRVVSEVGNPRALQAIEEVFQVQGAAECRGLGVLDDSRVMLRDHWQAFDADRHFEPPHHAASDDPRARCGDVLRGRCKPQQCPLFANLCQPQSAFGALMVSSEGACAACYQYRAEESPQ
ncbi:MAG: hydrogenase formation protein HypD [Enterobacteriaceae bacterium]